MGLQDQRFDLVGGTYNLVLSQDGSNSRFCVISLSWAIASRG